MSLKTILLNFLTFCHMITTDLNVFYWDFLCNTAEISSLLWNGQKIAIVVFFNKVARRREQAKERVVNFQKPCIWLSNRIRYLGYKFAFLYFLTYMKKILWSLTNTNTTVKQNDGSMILWGGFPYSRWRDGIDGRIKEQNVGLFLKIQQQWW